MERDLAIDTQRLETIETALRSRQACVRRGCDYDPWDLSVRGGLFSSTRLRMTIEEHGDGKQMIKARLAPYYPLMGLFFIILTAVLAAYAILDHSWIVGLLLFFLSFMMAYRAAIDSLCSMGVCVSVIENYERQVTRQNDAAFEGEPDPTLPPDAETDGLPA
jgi:hypothetical protein